MMHNLPLSSFGNMRESIITKLKETHYTGWVLDTTPHTCASPYTQISRHNDAVSFKKYFIFSMFLLLKFLFLLFFFFCVQLRLCFFSYFLFSYIFCNLSCYFFLIQNSLIFLIFIPLFLFYIFSMLAYCFHVYVYFDQFCSSPMILKRNIDIKSAHCAIKV